MRDKNNEGDGESDKEGESKHEKRFLFSHFVFSHPLFFSICFGAWRVNEGETSIDQDACETWQQEKKKKKRRAKYKNKEQKKEEKRMEREEHPEGGQEK